MLRFLNAIFQGVLALFFIACILVFIAIFAGIGFGCGVMLACWEDVSSLDLARLEYKGDKETWRQHLEVYSSVCEVQEADNVDFLIDKLERLEYEQVGEIIPRLSTPGEYATELNTEKSGTVRVHLREFEYPRLTPEAGHVQVAVRAGKIVGIRNAEGSPRQRFYLEPELIDEFSDEEGATRRLIPLIEMPEKLYGAFIAIEDRRFYNHWGIDIIRLSGAFGRSIVFGRRLSGTSTLTQQLARNIYLGRERELIRKTREMLLAVRVEKTFSKDEILERYLNYVDLGRYRGKTLHGVQQAAHGYFGKEVSELTFHECAVLAALPKAPSDYSPVYNPQKSKQRRDTVLQAMLNEAFITDSEYLASINAPLIEQTPHNSSSKKAWKEAGHFLAHVHRELVKFADLKDELYSGGLKVYTTIDMSMQAVAEKTVAAHLRYMDGKWSRLPDYDANKMNPHGLNPIKDYLQAALIAFEPKTGHIKAMVGGRDYNIYGKKINFYNRAIGAAKRQPGSAFKPIVFASLLAGPHSLLTPGTPIIDERWGIVPAPGQPTWYPRNYSKTFRGAVNLRDVLTASINVPTARSVLETPVAENGIWDGINRIVSLAKKMGIQSFLDPKPALTLGSSGITVQELTSAYGIFASGGIKTEPVHIQYIVDSDGHVIYPPKGHQVERPRVLDEGVAYQITSCLQSVMRNGTGRRAGNMGLTRPSAGKTGTTNDYVDAWFVGYTTDMVVGVWVGFDEPIKPHRHNYNQQGAWAALPIWARFMIDASRGSEKEFPVPENIVFREVDKTTGGLRRVGKCPEKNISNEPFIRGQEPQHLCPKHR